MTIDNGYFDWMIAILKNPELKEKNQYTRLVCKEDIISDDMIRWDLDSKKRFR